VGELESFDESDPYADTRTTLFALQVVLLVIGIAGFNTVPTMDAAC